MWGTPSRRRDRVPPARFIPTHVGNTRWPLPCRPRRTVHPHACGEHVREYNGDQYQSGSSPRMWGTLAKAAPVLGSVRFIPTHVGNTLTGFMRPSGSAVHPHACGEHSIQQWVSPSYDGSSPRMWGTLFIKKLIKIICYVFKPKLRG